MNEMIEVWVNVYDLHPANATFSAIGLGAYHSGVEIMGTETTFGHTDEGTGVFEHEPRQAPGARFRWLSSQFL